MKGPEGLNKNCPFKLESLGLENLLLLCNRVQVRVKDESGILRRCDWENDDTFNVIRGGKERGRTGSEEGDEWVLETMRLGC